MRLPSIFRFKSSFLPAVILLSAVSFIVPAISAESYATASGGVTGEDRAAFDAAHNTESLKLVFAGPTGPDGKGEYLSDVAVSIRNEKGDELIGTTATGPYFVAALPPGVYTVKAGVAGEVQTQRVVIDRNGMRKSYTMRFTNPQV